MGAVGLPLGSRIFDRRQGIPRESRIRYDKGATSTDPAKTLTLIEELEELPTRKR